MNQKEYDYWLCAIPGVGNRTIEKLQGLGTAQQIYHATEEEWATMVSPAQLKEMKLHKKNWALGEEYAKLQEKGIQFILRGEPDYPKRLLQIPDAPYGIFVKGQLPEENVPSVAIIGARDCSEYGRYIARALGKYLGEQGIPVISGMARGIDGISQEAALEAGGASVAVLGSGVDVCYPAQNRALYNRIQEQGTILSTFPPGTMPRAQNFPQRNRIVSGLADGIVVIEARQKSGTLITVDMALEQGKEVYVVPGRVTDRLSDGCNRLLKQGAGIFLSPEEFVAEMQEIWEKQKSAKKGTKETEIEENGSGGDSRVEEACRMRETRTDKREMEKQETERQLPEKGGMAIAPQLQPVYAVLDFYPQSVERLLEQLPKTYTVTALNCALMRLCLENYAFQVSPGHFCRKPEQALWDS